MGRYSSCLELDIAKKYRYTPMVSLALVFLKYHISVDDKTNFLTKDNGKPFRAADLGKELCVSRQSASKYVKILKDERILAVARYNNLNYLAMNPFCFRASDTVLKTTVELFG